MKKELFQEIEIPEGVEVKLEEGMLTVKGPVGEIEKKLNLMKLDFEINENKIKIGNKKSTKREKKMMNTIVAHINNMIKGVQEKFEYKLKVCFSHFPMTVDIKDEEAIINNFLGEKIPRKLKILKGVEVDVKGQDITINSINREDAGQTAANFEAATKVRARDRRIFQDGIFITSKPGKRI